VTRSTTRPRPLHRHRVALVAVAVCGVALGACSSSNKPNAGSAAGADAAGIHFADCMRSHGVPSFPDPNPGGGGFQFSPGSGFNPRSPAVRSAQAVCRKLLPGGPGPGPASENQKLAMLRLAECMRSHGVPNFPDPTTNPPSGPPSGGGIAFGSPGVFLSVPGTLMQSPAFKQAATKCGFPGA